MVGKGRFTGGQEPVTPGRWKGSGGISEERGSPWKVRHDPKMASKLGQAMEKQVIFGMQDATKAIAKSKKVKQAVAGNMADFMETAITSAKGSRAAGAGKAIKRGIASKREAGGVAATALTDAMKNIPGVREAGRMGQDIGAVGGMARRGMGQAAEGARGMAGRIGGSTFGTTVGVGALDAMEGARAMGGRAMEGVAGMRRGMGRMGAGMGRGARRAGRIAEGGAALGRGGAVKTGKAMKFLAGTGPKMFKSMKGMAGKGMGMMGISLSLSSLLRQSQIFTGTIGSLFQIIGGFIDVLLAPFMPLFAKAMEFIAQYIPIVQKYAQLAYEWLEAEVFPIIQAYVEWWWGKIQEVWAILEPHVETTIAWLADVWEWAKTDLLAWVTDTAWPAIQPAVDWLVGAGDWILDTLWETIKTWTTELIQWAPDAWAWIENTAWPAIKAVMDYIQDEVWPLIKDLWETVKTWAVGLWDLVFPKVKEMWENLKDTIEPIIEEAKPIIMDIIDNIVAAAKPYFNMLWAIVEEVIVPLVGLLVKFVMFILGKIWGWLMKFLGWFWENIGKGVLEALKWWTSKLPGMFNAITAFIRDPMKYLVKWAAFILEKVVNFMDYIAGIELPWGMGKPFDGVMDALGRKSLDGILTDLNTFLDAKAGPGMATENVLTVNIATVDATTGAVNEEEAVFGESTKEAQLTQLLTNKALKQSEPTIATN
jgi:hypothetical protein